MGGPWRTRRKVYHRVPGTRQKVRYILRSMSQVHNPCYVPLVVALLMAARALPRMIPFLYVASQPFSM